MKITFFGSYDTKTTPRVQVLIDGIKAHNIKAYECNVPLKLTTDDRVAILRSPWKLPWLLLAITACWLRLIKLHRKFPKPDAVIVGHLGQFDIFLARWLYKKRPIILDYMISGIGTAQDRQISGNIKERLLRFIDNSALNKADIILVDTEEHRQTLESRFLDKSVVVSVGAPATWFQASAKPKKETTTSKRRLRVIFFGKFTPLQGTPTIGKALSLVKEPMEVTMVGKGQDLDETKKATSGKEDNTEINWVDWVSAEDLPGLVASHDICLGIFGTSIKAKKVIPNKLYQGAAVGCALITSDTVPQKRALKNAAIYLPAGNPEDLAATLELLSNNRSRLQNLRVGAYKLARKDFTPQQVVTPLLEKLNTDI